MKRFKDIQGHLVLGIIIEKKNKRGIFLSKSKVTFVQLEGEFKII